MLWKWLLVAAVPLAGLTAIGAGAPPAVRVADSVDVQGSFRMPSVAVDSVRLRIMGIGPSPEPTRKWFPPPRPDSMVVFRVVLPVPPAPGVVTYNIFAEVVTWKGSRAAFALSNEVLVTVAPPGAPMVLAPTITVQLRP